MEEVPFNRNQFSESEIEYLLAAIASGRYAGEGPFGAEAEHLLSEIHGGASVLLTTSCTSALELVATLLDVKQGDEIIFPSFTFPSSALAFVQFGAKPVFVDVREDTLNLDEERIEDAVTPQTKAICVTNYSGLGAELSRITEIANRHGIVVIEDNAHGLGGTAHGKTLGTFGTFSTLSFHESKNVSCGEGGALVLNDKNFLARAEILRQKGTNRSAFTRGEVDKYTWIDRGSSWVLSDLLASLLVPQLLKLEESQAHRKKLWETYSRGLKNWAMKSDVLLPAHPKDFDQTHHLFHVRTRTKDERDDLMRRLLNAGVHAHPHYQSLHSSPMGRKFGHSVGTFETSDRASKTLLRLPLSRRHSEADIEYVVNVLIG